MSGQRMVEVEAAVEALDTDDRYRLECVHVNLHQCMLGWWAIGVEDGLEYGDACGAWRTAEGLAEGVAAVARSYEASSVAGKTRRP